MRSLREIEQVACERLGRKYVAVAARHAWSEGDGLSYITYGNETFHADGTCSRLSRSSRTIAVYPVPYLRRSFWATPCSVCTTEEQ